MSPLDKLKTLFSGAPDHEQPHDDDHDDAGAYLQTPTQPDHIAQPTPEEIAAAAQAEPPTTTVTGLAEGEEHDESR